MIGGGALVADIGEVIHPRQGIQQGGFARAAGADKGQHQLALEALGNSVDHAVGLAALFFKPAARQPQGCLAELGIQPLQIIFTFRNFAQGL